MKNHLRCALCLALCLLLTVSAVSCAIAENGEVRAWKFTLTGTMDASLFGEDDEDRMTGFADLINVLSAEGTLTVGAGDPLAGGGSFDLNADLLLEASEDTRTNVHLFGVPSHYGLQTGLTGDCTLMLNNLALLEFAMKAYNHLDMPLQHIAVWVSPYVHTSAFDWIREPWDSVMNAEEGSRTIGRNELMELAAFIAENAEYDRTFEMWLEALFMEDGSYDGIIEGLEGAADWLDGWLAGDGITVTAEDDTETWTSGDLTLFLREGENWALTLPASADGYGASVTCAVDGSDLALALIITDEEEEETIRAELGLSGIPEDFPFEGTFTVSYTLNDTLLEREINTLFTAELSGNTLTLSRVDPENGGVMLSLTAVLEEAQADPTLVWTDVAVNEYPGAINVLSVGDESFADLVSAVKDNFASGIIPVLAHTPASAYDAIYTMLSDYGVTDMLTAGLE